MSQREQAKGEVQAQTDAAQTQSVEHIQVPQPIIKLPVRSFCGERITQKHKIMSEYQIQVNYGADSDSEKPQYIILSSIKGTTGFVDISFVDPKSGQKTKITICSHVLKQVMGMEKSR